MATPTIPAAPVAAPAPAAAPSPAASTAPVITATPAPAAPTATPAAGAPPSSGGPQPPAKPDASGFGNATDYYQADVTYQQELAAFKEANPDFKFEGEATTVPAPGETAPADGETKPAETEAKPAEGETKPTEETKAEEEPILLTEEQSLTPQALNELLKGDEALRAAVEANPKAKNALMKLAREHAELSQFKGIFPSADSAKFAQKEAAKAVSLRSQFQNADTPEGMAKAFDSFMGEFAVVDETGKQVIGQDGLPVFADDAYAFNEHIVDDRYFASALDEIEANLKANAFKLDQERQDELDAKTAIEILRKRDFNHRHESSAAPDPDLSSLAPDVRKQVEDRLAEAKRVEAANQAENAGKGKVSRQEQRQKGTSEFFGKSAARVWPAVDKIVEKLRAAGAIIPDWQLTTPLPGTEVSAFRNEVGNRIQQFVKADPYISDHMMQLELQYLANPNDQTMGQRVEYFDRVLQLKDESGRSLLNRIVSNIVHKYGTTVAEGGKTAETAPTGSKTPAQGTPVTPKQMTADDAWKLAEQQLSKEVQGWGNMSSAEQMTYTMGRQRELMTAKR